MSRKKITLAYISNDSDRKASYKKRKKGLIKKVRELSTLCGVDACAIIYGQHDLEPEVWPSRRGAQDVLERFKKLSETDRTRKMVNQESFTRQCIDKAKCQLQRLQRENRRKEMENFMYRSIAGMATLQDFDLSHATEMSSVIKQILGEIKCRMESLEGSNGPYQYGIQ